jgi:hypothetical protein
MIQLFGKRSQPKVRPVPVQNNDDAQTIVGQQATNLGFGYGAAKAAGGGINPGGASASTQKLVQGAQRGLSNPFEDIGNAVSRGVNWLTHYDPYKKGK